MGLHYSKEDNVARFQYVNKNGDRDSIYLGVMPRKAAEHHEIFLAKIVACSLNPGIGIDRQTAIYLEEISTRLKKALIKRGLYKPTADETKDLSIALGELIEKYLRYHENDKANTYRNIKLSCDKLLARFGKDKKISTITPTEVNHFEKHLYQKFAEATASRLIKRFRQLMRWAVGHGHVKENIFLSMRVGKQENRQRVEYVPAEKVQKAMDACINPELRFALFLARYMAFRTASESNSWRWSYIRFNEERVHVLDTKRTKCRILPMFENLYPFFAELLHNKNCKSFKKDMEKAMIDLKEALADWSRYGSAIERLLKSKGDDYIAEMVAKFPKGQDFVFSPEFRKRQSRASQMEKLKKKAKVSWQKDFQNLRASCESEWVAIYGIYPATEWTGNSVEVAQKHYCTITPDVWDRAIGKVSMTESHMKQTIQSLVKSFGWERIRTTLEEITDVKATLRIVSPNDDADNLAVD